MQKVEIICNNCQKQTFINRDPIYDGLKKIGEKLSCTTCGYTYKDEKSIPFLDNPKKDFIFNESDKSKKLNIFSENEVKGLCRQCNSYIINPFTQFCATHKREVEATDSCSRFEVRNNSENSESML